MPVVGRLGDNETISIEIHHLLRPEAPAAHSSSMTMENRSRFVVAVVIAVLAHVVAGYLYLVSGLLAPRTAVLLLAAWWVVLAAAGVWLVVRRSYLVLLVPVVAAATWFGVMIFGDLVLGWTA